MAMRAARLEDLDDVVQRAAVLAKKEKLLPAEAVGRAVDPASVSKETLHRGFMIGVASLVAGRIASFQPRKSVGERSEPVDWKSGFRMEKITLPGADGRPKPISEFEEDDLDWWWKHTGTQSKAWSAKHRWMANARNLRSTTGVKKLNDLPKADYARLQETLPW